MRIIGLIIWLAIFSAAGGASLFAQCSTSNLAACPSPPFNVPIVLGVTQTSGYLKSGTGTPTFLSHLNVATIPTDQGGDWIALFEHQGSAANNEELIRELHHSNFAVTGAIPQPIFSGFADRGVFGAPVGITTNDHLLILDGRGYDGTVFSDTAAEIDLQAAQPWTSTAHRSKMILRTAPNGSISAVPALTIDQDQSVIFAKLEKLAAFTVSTLPSCSGNEGAMAYVTDATSPTYNSTLTGGGSVVVPVFCNASVWVSH